MQQCRVQCRTAILSPQFRRFINNDSSQVLAETGEQPEEEHPICVRRPSKYRPKWMVFSGIQPTGVPHLGNYLGALKQWVQLQERDYRLEFRRECLFSIVDLHALTVPQNPGRLVQWRKETAASLLAIGLGSKESPIFLQSQVSLYRNFANND